MPYDPPDDPAFWPAPAAWAAPPPSDAWPTPESIEARLDALEGPYAERVDLGHSVEGRPITAVRIARTAAPAWAVRVLGTHHGDEPVAALVAVALAERLVADPTRIPADAEVWIAPDVNPDGLAAHTRANAHGVDLNRNYDYEWGPASNPGSAPFSEPETRAVRAFTRARGWLGGLTLHAGATNIGWPWNYTTAERAADEPRMSGIADDYAAATTAPDFWTTNGADWYVTHGDSTDWSYGRWGVPEWTLELSDTKAPADPDAVVAWHLDALLDWLDHAPDLRATATAASTGEPVPVTAIAAQPRVSADGTLALWTDAPPATWVSAGFDAAPWGQPLAWTGVSIPPQVLSRGADPLPVPDGWVGLAQPGEAAVTDFPGGVIDPTTLAPGLWDVQTVDGAAPRSLLVGELDDTVRIDDAAVDDGVLRLAGAGFGRGAEAWGVGGPVRALHRLTPLSAGEDTLEFLWSAGDDTLLLWTDGAWLGAVGMDGDPAWDDTPPGADVIAGDTPPAAEDDDTGSGDPLPGCGGGRAFSVLGPGWAALGARRRRAGPAARRPGR